MIDFISGALSGIAQTIVGHPLDTIKVNIQNGNSIKNLRPLHYFRGIIFPLTTATISNSICFGVHKNVYDVTQSHIISGAAAGLCGTPIVHLSCIGKVKQQVGNSLRMRDFIYTKGIFSNCYCELIGISTYFYTYHTLKDNNYSIVSSGALAGLTNWTLSYPFDTIRNRQYASNIDFKTAFKQGNLYKGFIPCAIRSVIVNGTGFWVYEKCVELLTS